jgi:myo-inositol 2-dehydrogenase/D-chiro-inositol 1-dehydrogenase
MTWNIAFYGAGDRARPYLDALARQPDVQVAAVCDLDRRAAEQTAAGWHAQVFLSYEAMLEEARPNALWICVPPHLQGDVILKAAERGIPFFVEAPGAVDYQRARIYSRMVREARLATAVGFASRYGDVVREAREYLGAHSIPLALGWWLAQPEEPPPAGAASLLWTDACRLVDALRFFCGEVTRVRALSAGPTTPAGGMVVQLEFAGGSVGMLTCGTFARPEPRVELEMLGEGWSIAFGPGLATLRLAESDKTTILRCLNNPAAEQTRAFLEAAVTGKTESILVDYADALRTLAVCHAAAVSAREDRPVELAEVEEPLPMAVSGPGNGEGGG